MPDAPRVLDLGSAHGSFDTSQFPGMLHVCADIIPPEGKSPGPGARCFVQADPARLPFRNGVFDAVICNHSLEWFQNLDGALKEIGRVLKRTGAFFAALPDSSALSNRFYRWLDPRRPHVNQFSSAERLSGHIAATTGLRPRGIRTLFTSLSFLNSVNFTAPPPRRIISEMGIDREEFLVGFTWFLRKLDSIVGSRTSVYGWAFYFGTILVPIDETPSANVCARCGGAHPSEYLESQRLVCGDWPMREYKCPACGARNLFLKDESMRRVR
jgi:SAM-dependent methyltransferase